MITFITHITTAGDRFDLIAYQYWGDAGLVPQLLADNIHLNYDDILPEGLIIFVRDIDNVSMENNITTPPWR